MPKSGLHVGGGFMPDGISVLEGKIPRWWYLQESILLLDFSASTQQ